MSAVETLTDVKKRPKFIYEVMPFIWALTPNTRFNFRCIISNVLAHIFG